MEMFVIITMKRGITEATGRYVLSAGKHTTRADLYQEAINRLAAAQRNQGLKDGAVLFFSAEPLRLGSGSGAPVGTDDILPLGSRG